MPRTKLSEEHKRKISEAMKNKTHSEESKAKISSKMKGNQNARKKVHSDES